MGLCHVIKVRILESKHVTKCQVKKETNTGWKKRPPKTIPRDQGLNLNPHKECLVVDPDHHPPMLVDSCLCKKHYQISLTFGGRDDVDSKIYRFLYACGVPFNVLRSPYWHEMVQAINGALKGYKSLKYDKAKTMGLIGKEQKMHNALGHFTNDWN